MFELNIFSIFAATFLAIAIGIVWYSPWLFGRVWMHAVGVTEEDLELSRSWHRMVLGGVSQFCFFLLIGNLFTFVERSTLYTFTFLILGIVLSFCSGSAISERKSFGYFLVTAGYTILVATLGIFVIALWPW